MRVRPPLRVPTQQSPLPAGFLPSMQHTDHHALLRPWQTRLLTAGFTPSSKVDWPGRCAATVFLRGCPWRCAYCHNPQLQSRKGAGPSPTWAEIVAALEAGRGQLEGVVFSGGEPTADTCLAEAIRAVRAMGFEVGLHTGGAYPERLEAVLPLLDWVGFDLKTDYESYPALTGAPGSGARATRSAHLIVDSGVAHECRLTWHPQLISEDSALLAAHFAHQLGLRHFVLQEYRNEGVCNPDLAPQAAAPARLIARVREVFPQLVVRGEICGLAPEETTDH